MVGREHGQAQLPDRVGGKEPGHRGVRGPGRRPPVLVGSDEPFEELGQGPAGSLAVQRAPVDPEARDEIAAVLLDLLGVAVHGKRPLHRTARDRVIRDNDPHLPHPRVALPHRPRTPLHPLPSIPIPIVHPYRYRDGIGMLLRGYQPPATVREPNL